MKSNANQTTQGTTLLTIPAAAAAEISTVNLGVDAVTRRLQAARNRQRAFTRFLYHSTCAALRRGGSANLG